VKRRALLYADPSPRGEWALGAACLLAQNALESVTVLATEEDLRTAPDLLDRMAAPIAALGLPCTRQARPGPAEAALVAQARAESPDLVIVPPAGRNAIQRMLRGSRIATVVREVNSDVLVARRPPARIGHVLGCLSGGDLTERVAEQTVELAKALGAEATLLHVSSEVRIQGAPEGEATTGPTWKPSLRVLEAFQPLRHRCALRIREGLVVDEVLREADSLACDLVVIGETRSPEGSRWLREDVTERILLQLATSVLVLRRPHGAAAPSDAR